MLAAAFGLGPAVAWDMTTQPPRAEPRSAWPKPSPWKAAGAHMRESARAVAQVYLPPRPDESASPTPAAAPTALATAVTTATSTIRSIPHPVVLRAITLE
jgi:hypothetical protein